MRRFDAAPWSKALKVVSAVATIVLVAVMYAVLQATRVCSRVPVVRIPCALAPCLPLAILVFALLFIVRGYEVEANTLYVDRLLWRTRIRLDGLQRAWQDGSAMTRSLRLFGNGGLFAITGLFQNPKLGRYRAFVTDPGQAVILRLPSRTVAVSPAEPRAFLAQLKAVFPAAVVGEPPSAA